MTPTEAKQRLEIVRLRNLAGWQRDTYAAGHRRQAEHPIYWGQALVCEEKARQAERFAAENDAKADLLEAELGQ